jgi:hypothetical protein
MRRVRLKSEMVFVISVDEEGSFSWRLRTWRLVGSVTQRLGGLAPAWLVMSRL